MNITAILVILKLLDAIHDYLLCPVFGDEKVSQKDLDKIQAKLNEIETLLLEIREGKR